MVWAYWLVGTRIAFALPWTSNLPPLIVNETWSYSALQVNIAFGTLLVVSDHDPVSTVPLDANSPPLIITEPLFKHIAPAPPSTTPPLKMAVILFGR